MLIIHERNRVINLYYNQRNTTHEIAKIEKYQPRYSCYHKEERERERERERIKKTEVQISRAIFRRLQTPFQREEFSRTS
jgi:hypothetical protein